MKKKLYKWLFSEILKNLINDYASSLTTKPPILIVWVTGPPIKARMSLWQSEGTFDSSFCPPLSPAPPAKERQRVLCCLPRLFTAKPEPSLEGRLLGPRKATFQNDNKSTPRFHSADRPRSALDMSTSTTLRLVASPLKRRDPRDLLWKSLWTQRCTWSGKHWSLTWEGFPEVRVVI